VQVFADSVFGAPTFVRLEALLSDPSHGVAG
jgi:hypothetical protein